MTGGSVVFSLPSLSLAAFDASASSFLVPNSAGADYFYSSSIITGVFFSSSFCNTTSLSPYTLCTLWYNLEAHFSRSELSSLEFSN